MADTEVKNGTNGHVVDATGDHGSKKGDITCDEKLQSKIVRQVEHYFGDYNLPRDKFLKETIQSDEGWVSMDVMMKFQRLAGLSEDPQVIMSALKKGGSGLMEVDEEKNKIRRCPTLPLPEWNDARREELMNNTVYVKGFEKTKTTLDDLLEFFGKYPNVLNVTKRLYEDRKDPERKKHFKGSVFVVFKDRDGAEKFMDTKSVKSPDGNEELIRKWQKDYMEEQDKEFDEKRKQRSDWKRSTEKAKELARSIGLEVKKESSDLQDKNESSDILDNAEKAKAPATSNSSEVKKESSDLQSKNESPELLDKNESSDFQMKGRGGQKRRGSFSQGRGAKRGRGGSRGGRGCYNCNQDGHKAKDCPDGGGDSCFNCKQVGHMKKDCPDGGDRSCFNCKQDGHMKKDCPEPDRRNQPKTEKGDSKVKTEGCDSAIAP